MTQYIADTEHYNKVIPRIPKVKRLLWIATADLKDLYVKKSEKKVVPLLQILNDLIKKGVEVPTLIPSGKALIANNAVEKISASTA